MFDFNDIVSKFQVQGDVTEARPLGHGRVNHTFEVVCGGVHYVLQEINHVIFKYPVEVVNNQFLVTEYLRKKISEDGGDPDRETLTFIRTKADNQLLQTEAGGYFRMYRMVEGGREAPKPASKEEAYQAAAVAGRFQHRMYGFDANQLSYTFPRLHDMKNVIHLLLDAVRADMCYRTSDCQEQIRFVLDRSDQMTRIMDAMDAGEIRRHVVHNDAGYSNVLLDAKTGKGLCMLDLDTLMPGCVLYDFGELVRAGASSVTEYDRSGDVELNLDFYRSSLEGYLTYMNRHLSDTERELIGYSVWLMTMEKGIGYLTDYLNGDQHVDDFASEKQNLFSAVNQFFLVLDIEEKKDVMDEILKEVLMSAE